MQKGLIGVIVPVYKVEKYIAECIESILAQTYTNFRLILVDDGTPDNAGKICDEYAKKDSRITVIHQENVGVTRARARGVKEAEDCEWITFVDSDDTITESFLESFYDATNNDVDIIINEKNSGSTLILAEEYLRIILSVISCYYMAPWNKLFRRQLFTENVFDIPRDIIVGEDVIMNARLNFNNKKKHIAIINKDIYNYRQTCESAIHTHTTNPDYEDKFNNILIGSIPPSLIDEFKPYTINNRLKNFYSFWGYKYSVKDMKTHNFYQELKNDIKTYEYKLSVIDKIIFHYENPIIRFFAINTKKLRNKIIYR